MRHTVGMHDFSDCCKPLILNIEDHENYIQNYILNKVAGVKNGYPICYRYNPRHPENQEPFIYFDKSFGRWVIAGKETYGPYLISDSPEFLECPEFVESWDNGQKIISYFEWKPKIIGGKLKCDSVL